MNKEIFMLLLYAYNGSATRMLFVKYKYIYMQINVRIKFK
jgi:hypothetical protein